MLRELSRFFHRLGAGRKANLHTKNQDKAKRVLNLIQERHNEGKSRGYLLGILRKIDPFVFEELLLECFERKGYKAIRNKRYTGDGGIDGQVISPKGQRYLIQAKRYSKHIKAQDVIQFSQLVKKQQTKGFFIHTGRTGEKAKHSQQKDLRIVSGDKLLDLVLQASEVKPIKSQGLQFNLRWLMPSALLVSFLQFGGMLNQWLVYGQPLPATPMTLFSSLFSRVDIAATAALILLSIGVGVTAYYHWQKKRKPVALFVFVGGIVLAWGVLIVASASISSILGYSHPIFTPFFFFHLFVLAHQSNHIAVVLWVAGFVLIAVTLGIPVALFYRRKVNIYGDARWSTWIDIFQSGLLRKEGIILAKKRIFFKMRYLMASGYEHICMFAPSGAGKSTAFAITNLLTWQESAVVTDIKGELFKLTARFRRKIGQKVYCIDPLSESRKTHRYNPFDFISDDEIQSVDDLQFIIDQIIVLEASGKEFFANKSKSLFLAIALYLHEHGDEKVSIGESYRFVANCPSFDDRVRELLKKVKMHPIAEQNFYDYINQNDNLRPDIRTSFLQYLSLWANPIVDAATATSDFDLRNMRKERMTIYLCSSLKDLERLSPLMTIFYKQLLGFMTGKEPDPATEKHGVLLLMDEFSALGKLEALLKSIGLLRSFMLRVAIILQSVPQLHLVYGKDGAEVLLATKYRLAYAQNNKTSANEVSGMLGTKTVKVKSVSYGGGLFSGTGFDDRRNTSYQYVKRELMMPHEVMQLNKKRVIIILENSPPILADKSLYYLDKELDQREMGPIDLPKITPVLYPFHSGEITDLPVEDEPVTEQNMTANTHHVETLDELNNPPPITEIPPLEMEATTENTLPPIEESQQSASHFI